MSPHEAALDSALKEIGAGNPDNVASGLFLLDAAATILEPGELLGAQAGCVPLRPVV